MTGMLPADEEKHQLRISRIEIVLTRTISVRSVAASDYRTDPIEGHDEHEPDRRAYRSLYRRARRRPEAMVGAGRHRHRPTDGGARRQHREHRPAVGPTGPGHLERQPAVGGYRLRARLRRAAPA